MASSIARRLIFSSRPILLFRNPSNSAYTIQNNTTLLLNPYLHPNSHFLKPFFPFSTSANPNPNPTPTPKFQHQEVEGPTVEHDASPLANETRQVIASLRRSIHTLSTSLALLSFAQLGLGAYSIYTDASNLSSISTYVSFAVPFSMAFLMRRSLKDVSFFQKMEEMGRLQVLTLGLQTAKCLNVLFLRMRVGVLCCVVGIAGGSLFTLWLK